MTNPRGTTTHYERRDDGFYTVWGADFTRDQPGERRIYDGGELRTLAGADETTQELYMDLRTRGLTTHGVTEMGRCKRCRTYILPSPAIELKAVLSTSQSYHECEDIIAEMVAYAKSVLPENGCPHETTYQDYIHDHILLIGCHDCGAKVRDE